MFVTMGFDILWTQIYVKFNVSCVILKRKVYLITIDYKLWLRYLLSREVNILSTETERKPKITNEEWDFLIFLSDPLKILFTVTN
jgi:hypothetical protein